MNVPQVIYRPFRSTDSVPEITALLHRAYGALLRLGFKSIATQQSDEVTLRRLLRGRSFVAETEGRIVGTITACAPDPTGRSLCFRKAPYFEQFAVHPDCQKLGVGSGLLRAVERFVWQCGARALALDTAEGATALRAWYGARGYAFVEFVQWSSVDYRSVVLAKALKTEPAPLAPIPASGTESITR